LNQWKIKGLKVGTLILVIGIIFVYASLSQGIIGYTEISYDITIVASEETTFFLTLPVYNTTGEAASFITDLRVEKGNATWKLSETQYGKALEINTSGDCRLSLRKNFGYKDKEENDRWFKTYNFSMIKDVVHDHYKTYIVYVYASKSNCTVEDISLKMDSGLGDILSYRTFNVPLDEGWQTIEIEQSMMCV